MLTSALLFAPLVLSGLSVALALPVLVRLYRKCRVEEITPEWLESFSAASYEPMQDLLAQEDFRFLSRQPGFDFSLYRKLRRERLHIFRQYLNQLVNDFNRLHRLARVLVAHNTGDRSDVAAKLVWLKFRFALTLVRTEANYQLCCFGLRYLAVRPLIFQLNEMYAQLGALASPQTA